MRMMAIVLLLAAAAGAAPVEKKSAAVWIEAETAAGARPMSARVGLTTRAAITASAGALLGIHCDKTTDALAQWTFATSGIAGPIDLFIRYAAQDESGFEVLIDGVAAGTLPLAATGGWGYSDKEWAWRAFQLARDLEAGAHKLALRPRPESPPVNLDCLGLARGGGTMPGRIDLAALAVTSQTLELPVWSAPAEAIRTPVETGLRSAAIWGGGDKIARHYAAEWLPALFERTLDIAEMAGGLEWIFTGPEGGFTLAVESGRVRLTQRYYNSFGLTELRGGKPVPARHPERPWLAGEAAFTGALQAVTVTLGPDMQVAVRLNGREALRQRCLFDVTRHQVRLTGSAPRLRAALLAPPARRAAVRLDPARKHQTMIGFGGIGAPLAYASLSDAGKRRWWELVAEYNLLVQREYPIGTRLSEALDNWDNPADATPHYYADNFPNGEISDFAYNKTIRKLGGSVWFEFWALPPWTNRPQWTDAAGKTHNQTVADPDKWAGAVVNYCRTSARQAGAPPDVVGLQNEAGQPPEIFQQMALTLRRALDAAGFRAVKIHLCDSSSLKGGIERAASLRENPAAWAAIDFTASHMYDYQGFFENPDGFDPTIARWNAAAAGKPFLSTELCVNSTAYQVPSYRLALAMGQLYHKNLALADAAAICYCWTLLGVEQPSYGWTRTLMVPDPARGAVPVPSSAQLRVFGAFSRRVRRGMERIDARTADPALLATAFAGREGTTVVLLNRGLEPARIGLESPAPLGLRWIELADPYHENEAAAAPPPRPDGSVSLTLAPGALATLSNVELGRLPDGFQAER